jgi:hypothetical protein
MARNAVTGVAGYGSSVDRSRFLDARERVHAAIVDSVDAAERELEELRDSDTETRLSTLISGWARGLAAALEELAVAVDGLEQRLPAPAGDEAPAPPPSAPREQPKAEPDERDLADASEGQLLEEAKRSRAATAELRQESEDAREELGE